MKNKKYLIISIIGIVVLTIIVIIVLLVGKENKESENNKEIIRKNYKMLTESVNKYNEIRTKYSEMTGVLVITSFKDKYEELDKLMTEYNTEMENIDTYISNIKLRCDREYNDSEIDKVCNNYKNLYEKLVNLYVGDVENYNKFITEYNKSKNESLELMKSLHDKYIDYDEDGNIDGGAKIE